MSEKFDNAVAEKDVESGVHPSHGSPVFDGNDGVRQGSIVEEIAETRRIQNGFAPFRVLRQAEEWMDNKMGIETQGIDRIPEADKKPPSIWNSFFMWFSMTCHVGTLPIGILGPEFGLSLPQCIAAIIVGTWLGALCTAYCGTLGPKVSKSDSSGA
jgi:Permease for cytosine/purines, uracil, thiamine, allantoin